MEAKLSGNTDELMDSHPRELPFVTVVMPILNEATFINRSLGAVLAQDYPRDRMEVVVADGMSTDGTRKIIEHLQLQHSNLRLIDNHGTIVSTGLNAAIAQANGEIIVLVGGHCEIARDYVRRCVEHLQDDGVGVVGGPMETVGETIIARIIAAAMASPFGVGGSAFRTVTDRTMLVDTVAFAAYRRDILERAGPFDEELVRDQDDEYNYRLRKMGIKILLAADVQSCYYSRSSLRALRRQYFQYGYWKVRVMQKHPHQMRPRQFVPPLFAAALFGLLLLALLFPFGRVLLALVAGSYVLADLGASVWIASKSRWCYFFPLLLVFATLHLSFGLGFLVGLVRFWDRWGDTHTQTEAVWGTSIQAQG